MKCPICLNEAAGEDHGHRRTVDCPVCGKFDISETAVAVWGAQFERDERARAIVSHAIRTMQRPRERPFLGDDKLKRLISEGSIPSLREQANNLVRWLGDKLRNDDPAAQVPIAQPTGAAIMGAKDARSAVYVVKELDKRGIINRHKALGTFTIGLTFEGWELYQELQRSHSEGPIAFMAMPFGDALLDRVYRNCFKPAVEQTGFDLRRIDDKPLAGSIDNRLRVEIRKSRFLISELTNSNAGAYWEAGFAEGLGRPVIFTCKREYFQARGTHFDTRQQQTIVWSESELDAAAEQLKAMIRATLPSEAKLSDG